MYCPNCHHPNPADANECIKCQHPTAYFRDHIYFGDPFVFLRAEESHPVALKVDETVQTYRTPTIFSRYQHAIEYGDGEPASGASEASKEKDRAFPLPPQPRLPIPTLKLLTVITDRKIYKPGAEAGIFIVAPDLPNGEVGLEIKLGRQKVYEAKVALNQAGLALYRYADFKEGEYTVVVTAPDQARADCSFSAAEFTLSPLIATLDKHDYAGKRLKFALNLLVLSRPYSGPVEFGLQCQVCGERVVATQKVSAQNGRAEGDFDLSSHGGPFHVQVTTPEGHTALVSFPGTGVSEREHIQINTLGQTMEAGLLPWAEATPIRGLYLGAGELITTPLMLDAAIAERGQLKAAADIPLAQVVTIDPRTGERRVNNHADLKRGAELDFAFESPYTFFCVGAFTGEKPFVGWGIVFKPLAFAAQLTAPKTAKPAEEIDVHLRLDPPLPMGEGPGVRAGAGAGARGVFCLLLAYDARLEHESPLPKLAKEMYESIRTAINPLLHSQLIRAADYQPPYFAQMSSGAMPLPAAAPAGLRGIPQPAPKSSGLRFKRSAAPDRLLAEAEAVAPQLVVAPTRMEFPELVHFELFYFEGEAARTIRLGDQIGAWRVRAYVISGVDCQELTAEVQADKPLYAELDVPAIASQGDNITAAVNYHTRSPAELVITTLFGETRARVNGSGAQTFTVRGPGRVDVRIENEAGADGSVRDVARPGVQKVTASQLLILDNGQTARGAKVVAYPSPGYVLRDTIDSLLRYPFG